MATIKQLTEGAMLKVGDASYRRSVSEESKVVLPQSLTETNWQTFIPPCNGYLECYCEQADDTAYMSIKDGVGSALETRVTAKEKTIAAWTPVWKGHKAYYRIYKASEKRDVSFWKSVGGGV